MAKTVRVFFALRPDEEGLDFLTNRIQLFRGRGWEKYGRFIESDDLHVTMRFLGELEPDKLESIKDAAREISASFSPFKYEIGRCILFPRVSRARIIASQVKASPEMKELARQLEETAVGAGLEPETFNFKPHVTIARLRKGQRRPNLPTRPGAITQTATELELLESTMNEFSATYSVVESYPFTASEG